MQTYRIFGYWLFTFYIIWNGTVKIDLWSCNGRSLFGLTIWDFHRLIGNRLKCHGIKLYLFRLYYEAKYKYAYFIDVLIEKGFEIVDGIAQEPVQSIKNHENHLLSYVLPYAVDAWTKRPIRLTQKPSHKVSNVHILSYVLECRLQGSLIHIRDALLPTNQRKRATHTFTLPCRDGCWALLLHRKNCHQQILDSFVHNCVIPASTAA